LQIHELGVVVGDVGGLQLLVALSRRLDVIFEDETTTAEIVGGTQWTKWW
jgi:hypothetical protein